MQKLWRAASLATFVYRSTPFLLLTPRLVCASTPLAAACHACLQQASYATKPTKPNKKPTNRKPKGVSNKDEASHLFNQVIIIRQACDSRNIQQIMQLYPTLVASQALNHQDTRRIAQALHVCARQRRTEDHFTFLLQFVADIRSGLLPPHPFAFVHLLGIYKDYGRFDEGLQLWQWLVEQDESYVSQAAYGAAIELMAYGGLSSLSELEDLYTQALKRFPGTFAEYHLSPDAIVPDRSQRIFIPGVPTVLLQGILTARILARDWKRAYLALDTILRLYPTQTPSRFFELFIIERPVTEAYTAFMIACRAGISLNSVQLTTLVTKLRAAMGVSASLSERTMILRAIANALYAHQEAGGQLGSLHVGVFLDSFKHLLPQIPAGVDYQGNAAQLRNAIVLTAQNILSGLVQAGLAAETTPFEALISMAGRLRVPDLLAITLQDVATAKVELGPIGSRSILTSAGWLQNKHLVQERWSYIVSKAKAEGVQIAVEDWVTLARACRRADLSDFFKQQLSNLSHTTTPTLVQRLLLELEEKDNITEPRDFDYMDSESFTTQMEELKRQMKDVEAVIMSGQPLDIRRSPFYMHLDPTTPLLTANENVRAVYDEYTTDPHQPPPSPAEGFSLQPAMSRTGIPLDELRFQNWATVLEMMNEAEDFEACFQGAMNQAIAHGNPFFGSKDDLALRKVTKVFPKTKEQLQDRIKVLRAPHSIALPRH